MSRWSIVAVTCLAFLLSDGGSRAAAKQHTTVPEDLAAARDAVWRAWFSYDRAVLERMLPADFVGIGWGGGPFDTRQSALTGSADFVRSGGKLRRLAFTDDRVQRFGPVATVFANYEVELEVAGQVTTQRGRATEVFVFRDGVWTNPAWHLDSGQ